MKAPLRFGVFITPSIRPVESPTVALQYDMERVVALDRLGYDEAWFGEHHSGGYELIACPEVFIAAAAERIWPVSDRASARQTQPRRPTPRH